MAMEHPPWRKMNLGEDPLDPHGDGTIREGDPMYQLLLNGPVQAIRDQEHPDEWDVYTDVPEMGRQVPEEFENKLKEGTLVSDNGNHNHGSFFVPDDSTGTGFGQKLFGFFWIVLGLWMLGTAFGFWGKGDELNLAGQILYVVIAGFNFVLAWWSLRGEAKFTGKRW